MESITISEILEAVQGTLIVGCKEHVITKVGTNSKENLENGLFVPISGERVDAHAFILDAIYQGAVATFTSKHTTLEEIKEDEVLAYEQQETLYQKVDFIAVADTKKALQDLAIFYRNRFKIPVIGISGSVGKTTTKEMIGAALETKYNVLKTFGNMNSQIGVALMMFHMERNQDVAVIEMGISEPNEMDRLVEIAQPKYAVLTNIGVSHIANLKTRENIRKEKTKIVNAFTSNSKLYVNGNDDLLSELYGKYAKALETYAKKVELEEKTEVAIRQGEIIAFGTTKDCSYQAVDVRTENEKTKFTLVYPGGCELITLNVMGIHNVYNALVALALADELGIEPGRAKQGLEAYEPIKMRGQIDTIHNIKIIDDTYNASPDSMKSGINVLASLDHVGRRIAVLADALELGEHAKECHYEVGKYILDFPVDILVTIGPNATYIAKALVDNETKTKTFSYQNNREVIEFLQSFVKPGDGILVKGSRGMHTEEIVEAMKLFAKMHFE